MRKKLLRLSSKLYHANISVEKNKIIKAKTQQQNYKSKNLAYMVIKV